ncbi:MAG: hypothetical protein J1F03_00210 [Oscillospiraceae bacterium]|nr:hypothetical protein [Oscillospiraceae bacterium]
MIDIENEVFTKVAAALRERFPKITVESVTTYSPSKFPFVCIEEADNYSYQSTRDSGSSENHVTVMYEVNVYSNKANGKKAECKAIIAVVDEIMIGLGFVRITKKPVNLDSATKYRIAARYSAVVSKTHNIYRR